MYQDFDQSSRKCHLCFSPLHRAEHSLSQGAEEYPRIHDYRDEFTCGTVVVRSLRDDADSASHGQKTTILKSQVTLGKECIRLS